MKITADIAEDHGFDILDEDRLHDMYDDYINELNGPVMVMGCKYGDAAKLWEEIDPTAYRCGYNDWLDGESKSGNITELSDGEWMDTEEYDNLVSELEDEENEEEEG